MFKLHPWFVWSILILSLGLVSASDARECPSFCLTDLLREEAPYLTSLAHAADSKVLDTLRASPKFGDAPTVVVYSVRRHELNPDSRSAEILIDAIPADRISFWAIYSISVYSISDVTPQFAASALEAIPGNYWTLAAQSVVRQGRGYRQFLRLLDFADGEVLDSLQENAGILLRGNREKFVKAFDGIDRLAKERFCAERSEPFCRSYH